MTPQNSNTEQESIIRKIQRLFSLAQSSNQAEAELAMEMAQKLLAKHNLNSAMVMATSVAGGTVAAAPEKREKTQMNRSAQYKWQQELWATIAKANFCWHSVVMVYEGKRGTKNATSRVPVKRHLILGRESNVMAVKMMGEYLEDTMERLLPFPNRERLSRSAISWKVGCAEMLGARIREQAETRKQESDAARPEATAGAMVLRDVYQAEYAANYDARYGEGAHARSLAANAEWEAGREAREAAAKLQDEKEQQEYLDMLQNETPAEKKRREQEEALAQRRAEAQSERWQRSWDRERREAASRIDPDARRAGRKAAADIGLDTQVGSSTITRKDRMVS